MLQHFSVFVTKNLIPKKRTGSHLLVFEGEHEVLAFGLSPYDLIRAAADGAQFVGRTKAEELLKRVKD